MRDAAMDVEEAMHVFMQHVDSSDLGKLVRAMNFFTKLSKDQHAFRLVVLRRHKMNQHDFMSLNGNYSIRKFRELTTSRLGQMRFLTVRAT